MHLQPVYAEAVCCGGRVSTRIFEHGLCLPSGSTLIDADVEAICGLVAACGR
jgi:hypothetical protein